VGKYLDGKVVAHLKHYIIPLDLHCRQ